MEHGNWNSRRAGYKISANNEWYPSIIFKLGHHLLTLKFEVGYLDDNFILGIATWRVDRAPTPQYAPLSDLSGF